MGNKKAILKQNYSANEDRSIGSVLFGIIGKLIIAFVLILCLPVAVPKILGYEVYNIVSGSMEPEIPVGSVIYAKAVDEPAEIAVGEIAVFEKEGFVVAHRVVSNDVENHEIHTKGDANSAEDMTPVPYQQIIGVVSFHVHFIGNFMFLFTSVQGKIYLLAFLFGGIMCNIASYTMRHRHDGSTQEDVHKTPDQRSAEKKLKLLIIIGILIAIVLLVILGILASIYMQYANERKAYDAAADSYTTDQNIDSGAAQIDKRLKCPIQVDFEELQETNPEIIGWIYCDDSVINYPICYSGDNDYYLDHAYDKSSRKSGAIFMEAANDSSFIDHNNILYGHHMRDKSMFATLSYWSDQGYYDAHQYMWLLTPEKTYRIDLISGYNTTANSDSYIVFQGYSEQLNDYISSIISRSHFKADADALIQTTDYAKEKYIMLSTCEYTSENARYVLHGVLHEVNKE